MCLKMHKIYIGLYSSAWGICSLGSQAFPVARNCVRFENQQMFPSTHTIETSTIITRIGEGLGTEARVYDLHYVTTHA